MLSLFCTWVCVVAQPNINAVHPAAIPLRKISLVGFITLNLVVNYGFELEFVVPAVKWLWKFGAIPSLAGYSSRFELFSFRELAQGIEHGFAGNADHAAKRLVQFQNQENGARYGKG